MSTTYHNPYSGQDFFGFFITFIYRIWQAVTGHLGMSNLASDEVQLLVLAAVAVSSALVGTFLVLRKMTMLANALSHTALLGIVIAVLVFRSFAITDEHGHFALNIQAMLVASVVMGLVTTFLTEFLSKTIGLQEDASTGVVFTTLFALGIVLVTAFTRNAHIGSEVVMGNVDALHRDDLKMVFLILGANILVLGVFFKEYTITTFDPGLARALGISATVFNYLLMVQVSMTVVGAFRAVGVLMVLAFLTGPTLTARLLTHNLRALLAISCAIGVGVAVIGVALSRHLLSVYGLALSTGGLTVTLIVAAFLVVAAGTIVKRRRLQKAAC